MDRWLVISMQRGLYQARESSFRVQKLVSSHNKIIQMSARSESVAKEIILEKKSKIKKDKKLRLYMHPPSIPTRFQTIHYDDGESKGFNSTSKRFTIKVSDLPGPGYYAKAAEGIESNYNIAKASISKRGYGVGFASQSRRFKEALNSQDPITNLSPAKYKPSTPTYSQSISHSISPAFKKPIFSADVPAPIVKTKTGIKPTPGPGEYSAEKALIPKKPAAESAFKSKSTRSFESSKIATKTPIQKEDPSAKRPIVEKEAPINPTSSFKASSRQYHDKPKIGPSIGQYDVVEKKIPRAPTKPPIKLQKIAKPPAKPAFPASIQTSIPGSGATPIAFPSPGRYDLAKGAEMMSQHRQAPIPRLGKSKRFQEDAFDAFKLPGPGSYKPFPDSGHRSFHLNIHGNWT